MPELKVELTIDNIIEDKRDEFIAALEKHGLYDSFEECLSDLYLEGTLEFDMNYGGCGATGPSYSCGGSPAEPAEFDLEFFLPLEDKELDRLARRANRLYNKYKKNLKNKPKLRNALYQLSICNVLDLEEFYNGDIEYDQYENMCDAYREDY
jgi:hypothetical protein